MKYKFYNHIAEKFFSAMYKGSIAEMEAIIKAGFNVDEYYNDIHPLSEAVSNEANLSEETLLEVLKVLTKPILNINNTKDTKISPILPIACKAKNRSLKVVKFLIDKGADVCAIVGGDGETSLIVACENNDIELAKLLLDNGAKETIDQQRCGYGWWGHPGTTALMCACKNKNFALAKLLLDNGANANLRTCHNVVALHFTLGKGAELGLIELLLDKTSPTNAKKALLYALDNNEVDDKVIELFVKKGVKINPTDCYNVKQMYRFQMIKYNLENETLKKANMIKTSQFERQ